MDHAEDGVRSCLLPVSYLHLPVKTQDLTLLPVTSVLLPLLPRAVTLKGSRLWYIIELLVMIRTLLIVKLLLVFINQ